MNRTYILIFFLVLFLGIFIYSERSYQVQYTDLKIKGTLNSNPRYPDHQSNPYTIDISLEIAKSALDDLKSHPNISLEIYPIFKGASISTPEADSGTEEVKGLYFGANGVSYRPLIDKLKLDGYIYTVDDIAKNFLAFSYLGDDPSISTHLPVYLNQGNTIIEPVGLYIVYTERLPLALLKSWVEVIEIENRI